VDRPTTANSFYIDELDVDPLRRGQGIGGQLLSWAVDEARRCGIVNMSLHTTTANPARRLYERHGFVVTQTAVDRRYEAYTGIAGHSSWNAGRPSASAPMRALKDASRVPRSPALRLTESVR